MNSGVNWTAKAWNGDTGGIMAFLANGTVAINGTITATGKGFRGGTSGFTNRGTQGEGVTGLGDYVNYLPNGNGGGAGQDYENQSGAGGGHAQAGGNGQKKDGSYPSIPQGGTTAGATDLVNMVFGGGGGSTGVGGGHGGVGPSGGNGGGIIWITAETLSVSSNASIVSNGNSGTSLYETASGGGAGGSVLLQTDSGSIGTSRISALEGSGVSGALRTSGAGSVGRIRVQYEDSLTGTTSPSANTSQATIGTIPAGILSSSGESTNLTKGDLTKEVKWLDGGTNPETDYEYDSYGNLTKSINPNDNETIYTYNINDSTRTYPERITNAKGQETNFTYDLGTGNILTKTDANGLTVTYEYDEFSRISKEIKPYDSSTYPTIQYTYLDDGVAPEGAKISTREVSGTSSTLDVFTLVDGFGRKVQTRRDAEDITQQIIQDTFYSPIGEVYRETVPYVASSSATTLGITPTPPPATKFGDGSDGDIAITGNITENPIDSSVTATQSATTATVGVGLGFTPNDIVLFHQTQGTNAGTWEFARVEEYSGTTLTLTSGLTNAYTSSGSNHAQVRVVPQYNNVTVHSSSTWKPKSWDGTTGGILVFLAKGTVTIDGTLTALGTGFRGGNNWNGVREGASGEGTGGSGSNSYPTSLSANGNGGGAGTSNAESSSTAGGGAGGGNGVSGSNGTNGNGALSNNYGIGGNSTGTVELATMTFGGGGGQGGGVSNPGIGGNGGGIVFITGTTVSISGGISAAGVNGSTPTSGVAGGGGGGAGGSVLINAQTATLGSGLVTSVAGSGASGTSTAGDGGNGGVGRIRVSYENSASGSATPTASTAQVSIPYIPAGTVPSEPSAYGVYTTPDLNAKYTEYTYDTLGRVTIVRNPKGDLKTTAYDHWKETDIDENGHIKRRILNASGKIKTVEEVIDFVTHETSYVYNKLDQLTQIIDSASNSGTMTYDTLGRKVSQTDPDMGTWSYAYDAAGNLISSTDAKNITVGRTYGELNRLTGVNYPNDTDLGFTYDVDKIGTLSVATDSAGTVSYTYDNRLRKTAETRVIDGVSKTTTLAYDSADRVTNQTNPDSTQSNYTFNNQGEIETLGGILDDVDYNALGKITEKVFDNGLTTNYTYNTDNFHLSRIQTGTLQDLNYTYDSVGNITSIVDDVAEKTKLFSYDDLDRLVTASESGGFDFAYEYNPIGNLTKFTSADTVIDYEYGGNAGPHAMTSVVASASGTASGSAAIEILDTPWTLSGNNGSDQETQSVDANILNGKTAVSVTFDLNGTSFGTGDDEASVVFVQGGEWMAANVIPYAQNGLDGEQTVEIPLSAFQKVNDTELLDPEGTVTSLLTRFWNSGAFTVDVTSVKVLGASSESEPQETELLSSSWTMSGSNGSDEENQTIPTDSLEGKTTVRVTFDLNGTSFGGGDDEASIIFVQNDWYAVNVTDYGTNGLDGEQTIDIPLEDFRKVNDTELLDLEASVSDVHARFWNSGSFTVDVTSIKLLGESESSSEPVNIAPDGSGYRWWYNASSSADTNKVAATELNDDNMTNEIGLRSFGTGYPELEDAWEAAGVVWSATQSGITSVEFTNGALTGEGDGVFTANFKLQFTTDGTTWTDSGWSYTPTYAYDSSSAADETFVFTGSATDVLGARVVGQVRTSGSDSWYAIGREFKVFQSSGSSSSSSTFSGELTYDANGNMTVKGDKCYVYNEANQMSKVTDCASSQTIAEYTYDYKGQRVIKENYVGGSLANTAISWSKGFETKDIVGGGTETTNYYFANNEVVAKKANDSSVVFFHNDHLGSNALTTNQAGAQVENVEYDPWGQVLGAATQSKYQYTGQEKDDETGLNYYGARFYDSELRRFTQPDSIIQDVYNPQSLNRYSYAFNNPLKYVDPSGHFNILNYNNALNSYYKNKSAKTYNYVLNTIKAIQTFHRVTSPSSGGSSSGGGRSSSRSSSSGGGSRNSGSSNENSMKSLVAGTTLSQVRTNYNNGYAFQTAVEKAAGFARNHKPLPEEYGKRIFDGWDEAKGIIKECKSGQYTCMNPQMRAMFKYARETKATFDIYYKEGGKFASTVYQEAANVRAKGGTVNFIKTSVTVGAAGASTLFIMQ